MIADFHPLQDYRDAISIPGTPNVSDARRLPADSIKPTGQVPRSSIPGSVSSFSISDDIIYALL